MQIHGKTTIEGEVRSVEICKNGALIVIRIDTGPEFLSYRIPWTGNPAISEQLPGCRAEIAVTVFEEEKS